MRTVRSKGLVTGLLLTDAHGFFGHVGMMLVIVNIHYGSSRIRTLQTKSSEGKKVNYGVSILTPSRNFDRWFSKDQALHQLGSSSSWMGKVESVGLVDEIRDY